MEAITAATETVTHPTIDRRCKEFQKIFDDLCRRENPHKVFHDFVTLASCSFLAQADFKNKEKHEADYMAVVGRWPKEDIREKFPKLLGITVLALEEGYCDFLGEVFMRLEIANKRTGQFFTPYHLSAVVAQLSLGNPEEVKKLAGEKKFITFGEPACGAGGMVIAVAQCLNRMGVNYQTDAYFECIDIDDLAARMCYLQLSILGIPAQVFHGNTLSMEMWACWPTLFFGRILPKYWVWRQEQRNPPANKEAPKPGKKPKVKLNFSVVADGEKKPNKKPKLIFGRRMLRFDYLPL